MKNNASVVKSTPRHVIFKAELCSSMGIFLTTSGRETDFPVYIVSSLKGFSENDGDKISHDLPIGLL